MPGKKVAGSLRSEGMTTIAVGKPTLVNLKRLAGDQAMCDYLRELLLHQLQIKQGSKRELVCMVK